MIEKRDCCPAKLNWGSEVRGFSGIPRNLAQFPNKLWGRGNLGNLDRGFFGVYPKKPQNSGKGTGLHISRGSGRGQGRGQSKVWGFLGEKSPKIVDFRGGDGGDNIGDFPHSSEKQ